MTISLIINAVTGRMGKELVQATVSDSDVVISAALARANHPLLETDIGYLIGANPQNKVISTDLGAALGSKTDSKQTQVLIDFSLPEHSIASLSAAVQAKTPMVIGTTGFNSKQLEVIRLASTQIPVMLAANYSLGVNTLILLARKATELLGDKADIEIFEAHHKHKVDAPSGTAIAIGEALAQEKGQPLSDIAAYDRAGERKDGDIGFSVSRAGEIIGDHDVTFAMNGELLSLKHHAQNRQCFAQGAIEAAKWLVSVAESGRTGLYNLQDMLADTL